MYISQEDARSLCYLSSGCPITFCCCFALFCLLGLFFRINHCCLKKSVSSVKVLLHRQHKEVFTVGGKV